LASPRRAVSSAGRMVDYDPYWSQLLHDSHDKEACPMQTEPPDTGRDKVARLQALRTRAEELRDRRAVLLEQMNVLQ
jgi:hypothetical protein